MPSGCSTPTLGPDSGVSFAAPQVTGLAGLLHSFDARLSADSIRRLIDTVAATFADSVTDQVGRKVPLLNAYASLVRAAKRATAPLCTNRVWAAGGTIYAQRTDSTTAGEDALFSVGSPAWYVVPMHGGHRIEYTTVNGRYSVSATISGWGTPVQIQDSLTALFYAPGYESAPYEADTAATDTILGGTAYSIFGFNHDADSLAMVMTYSDGTTDYVSVVRTDTAGFDAGGPFDTLGTISFAANSGGTAPCSVW
jgi:hypothetical protein